MKVKIAGFIYFGGSALCFIILLIMIVIDLLKDIGVIQYDKNSSYRPSALMHFSFLIGDAIPFLIMMLYIYWTKFGKKRNEADQIIYANQLQTKRDEQTELIRQLKTKSITK
ncbi:MAG TPA: hypothetical protein VGK10_01070 [Prolixibacteraceae bacterium]|jgi:large-conductance mechanosensitive channel